MLRAPDGGVENVSEMAAAGMRWLGLNVADYDPARWTLVRQRAEAAGVQTMPKGRLGLETSTRAECIAMLERICQSAIAWGTDRAIVNAEKELDLGIVSARDIAAVLDVYGMDGAVISTEAWLYANVEWTQLGRWPVLLQIYPEDNGWTPEEIPQAMASCVRRARGYGFTYVGVTYQAWRAAPEWYDRTGYAWSLAFGDDVGAGNWWRWA